MIVELQGALTFQSSTITVWADSGPFLGLLLTVLGSRSIFPLLNPKVCLHDGHQHQEFWPILARFMDNYSPFSGPKAISMVVKLQGALTCRSSTITVWADSGPFLGLLLTVLVSRSDFHD